LLSHCSQKLLLQAINSQKSDQGCGMSVTKIRYFIFAQMIVVETHI
jgi:hypothetical protein